MMEIKTPVSATLSPQQLAAIQDAISHYQAIKGGVMPVLHAVQGICGNWLPLEALKLVSEGMEIPYPYLRRSPTRSSPRCPACRASATACSR